MAYYKINRHLLFKANKLLKYNQWRKYATSHSLKIFSGFTPLKMIQFGGANPSKNAAPMDST